MKSKKKMSVGVKAAWIVGVLGLVGCVLAAVIGIIPDIISDNSPPPPQPQIKATLIARSSDNSLDMRGEKLCLVEGDTFRVEVVANQNIRILPLFLDSNGEVEVMRNCEGGIALKKDQPTSLPPELRCRLDNKSGTEVVILLVGDEIISKWRRIKETIEDKVGRIGLPGERAEDFETIRRERGIEYRERGIEYVEATDENALDKLEKLKEIVSNQSPASKLLIIWHL
jgi:hypothetical protein